MLKFKFSNRFVFTRWRITTKRIKNAPLPSYDYFFQLLHILDYRNFLFFFSTKISRSTAV